MNSNNANKCEVSSLSPAVASSVSSPSSSLPLTTSSVSLKPSSSFLRVKPGNFSRLLYTNPVCLLTSAAPTSQFTQETIPTDTYTTNSTQAAPTLVYDVSSIHPASLAPNTSSRTDSLPPNIAAPSSGLSLSSSTSASASESACSSSSVPSPSPSPSQSPSPSRNVMTISWLTATSNHGEFMMSMHSGRYSATFVHQQGDRFVLNVPVKGMEELVKRIGGCSGRDEEHNGKEKMEVLGMTVCRPGNKPIESSHSSSLPSVVSSSKSKHRSPAVIAEEEADLDDAQYNLFAVPGCAAHLVCEVQTAHLSSSSVNPLVRAHNILFCRVTRAYVDRDYWLNGNNFIPLHSNIPPYLTFLGSGNFAYVTR